MFFLLLLDIQIVLLARGCLLSLIHQRTATFVPSEDVKLITRRDDGKRALVLLTLTRFGAVKHNLEN
jgi:hypothetical protein